jgi:hypothetical protein
MPSYSNVVPPSSVGFGESAGVIAATDAIYPAPFKSAQVALAPNFSTGKVRCAVEIIFSGNPGTFAANLQTADTDVDADYVSIAAGAIANAQMNGTYVARLEIADVMAHFARIYIGTLPNNVSATAKISA